MASTTTSSGRQLLSVPWSLLRGLIAFSTALFRGWGDLGRYGPSLVLKRALSRGCWAWQGRDRAKRRLDLYDLSASDDPVKLGYIIPELEWDLEEPQSDERLVEHVDEFLCWGANKAGETLLVRLARQPGGTIEAHFQLTTSDGPTLHLPRALFADGSQQGSRRFSAGRLHVTCLRPMRKWRLTFNGHMRVETPDGTGELKHIDLRMFINAVSGVFDHYNDESLEAESLFTAQRSWGQVGSTLPRQDAYDQPVNMYGMLTVNGEDATVTSSREVRLWGLRQRRREKRTSLLDTRVEHIMGSLENRTYFHVSSEKISGATLKRGVVVAPNLFLHAVENWEDSSAPSTATGSPTVEQELKVRTAIREYTLQARRLETSNTNTSEGGALQVIEPLKLTSGTSSGHGIRLVLHRKLLNRKFDTVKKPPSGEDSKNKIVACLQDAAAWDSSLCGGKGSSIAALAAMAPLSREKFTVPGAVVLTTRAYAIFCTHNKLDAVLQDLRTYPRCNSDQRKLLSERLCAAVEKAVMPQTVVAQLEAQLQASLGERFRSCCYAVRSSAVGEDSEEMSCAGQMETFLNVNGFQEATRCAVKCWASQFRHVALEYKWQHGQPLEAPMAVLLQEMVRSDVSGVLFTCDPVGGDPSRLIINANFGLGESVVSSLAEPDTVILERSEEGQLRLLETQLGRKQVQVVPTAQGTQTVKVENAGSCSLTEEEALALGRAALEVQRLHPGTPDLDLEWAFVAGKLNLLQARPITSLHRENDFEIEHELDSGLASEDEFYTRANVAEVLPGAISPIGAEVFLLAFNILFKNYIRNEKLATPSPDTRYIWPASVFVSRNYMMSLVDGMFQHSKKQNLMTRGLLFGTLGRPFESEALVNKFLERHGEGRRLDTLWQIVFLIWAQVRKNKCIQNSKEAVEKYRIPLDDSQTAQEMFEIIGKHMLLPQPTLCNLLVCSMRSSFNNLMLLMVLASVHGDLTPEVFADISTLLSRCEQVESADVPSRLRLLARVIRRSRPDFSTLSVEEARDYLEKDNGEAGQSYKELIEHHGHRCMKEFDVMSLTWSMDPRPLIKTLQHSVAMEEAPSQESAPVQLATPLNLWRRQLLKVLVPQTKQAVGYREAAKAMVIRTIHVVRLALLRLGQKMVDEGLLPEAQLVFQLEVDEVHRLLATRSPTLVLKAIRRLRIHPTLNQLRFSDITQGVPRPLVSVDRAANGSAEAGVTVHGTPVSRGRIIATARVVKNLDAAGSIQPGDILVTNATDIGWSPYFPLLAGIVTEIGGLLSHGAVIAREYGLPCVVGVEHATDIFYSGDTVCLDATRGIVERVKSGSN